MHKSKGNAIPFDEAAEQIGADVMRWMYSAANPGVEPQLRLWPGPRSGPPLPPPALEQLRLPGDLRPRSMAGRLPRPIPTPRRGRCSTAGSCRASTRSSASRARRWTRTTPRGPRARSRRSSRTSPTGTCGATGGASGRASSTTTSAPRTPPCTRCWRRVARLLAPFVPHLADAMWGNLVSAVDPAAPDSVHLADYPERVPGRALPPVDAAMALARRVVALGRAARAASRSRRGSRWRRCASSCRRPPVGS